MKINFTLLLMFFVIVNCIAQENGKNELPIIIEEIPVFPGCKGDREQLKTCFSKSFQKFFATKFDSDLPKQLGLPPGEVKMNITFKINKEGQIDSVLVKAPHPKLISSIENVVSKLPEMKPGKYNGAPVAVKYSIPFKVFIEENRSERRARKKKERLERKNKN